MERNKTKIYIYFFGCFKRNRTQVILFGNTIKINNFIITLLLLNRNKDVRAIRLDNQEIPKS